MTSGTFHKIPLASLTIPARQRGELGDIPELAESIGRLGLIHPIVITRDNILVAGERRVRAHEHLGLIDIQAQYTDEIDPKRLHELELEENVKRKQLTWQEEVTAIRAYHDLKRENKAVWTTEKTAQALGLPRRTVERAVLVSDAMGDERVAKAERISIAVGIAERRRERQKQAEIAQIGGKPKEALKDLGVPVPSIINMDFHAFIAAYSGLKYNFIHCDFPYGINFDVSAQGNIEAFGAYQDDPSTYWGLLRSLAEGLDRIAAEHAHIMFWFSMKHYQSTLTFFSRNTDFIINPIPLVWMKSDNAGILPDPQRGPRQIYETALMGSRGDRKIVQAVANAYAAPSARESHISEKSEPMLRHFFRMFVDQYTSVFDPTCGSGAAIRAAESLGASSTLGLEINPEFAHEAQRRLVEARKKEKASGT